MSKILIKSKSLFFRGLAPYGAKGSRSGFVILYAVVISSMLLAIALGVASIAYKEIKFGTSAKDTNDAFFAADVGAECALLYDRSTPETNAFTGTADFEPGVSGTQISCAGVSITISGTSPWSFVVPGLGSGGQGCARVDVEKTPATTITSRGYNIGSEGSACLPGANAVERQLEVSY